MNSRLLNRFFQIAFIVILAGACAKISNPTGGKKDRIPPVLLKSTPANGAVNFNGKKLTFTFNEYVTLNNINDKFMVSPPLKKKPRTFLRKKSVVTEYEDELKDSTTYTFYYQDAIRDLNEGNKIPNFQLVFSTGAMIDSLSVTGNVYNSSDLEIPENVLVLMYSELADSVVEKHIPDYIARVDLTGYFRIDNIRPGRYRLYALIDNDNSKNYSNRDEEFAFMSSPIEVTPEKNFLPVVKDTTTIIKRELKATKPVNKRSTSLKPGEKEAEELPPQKGEYQLFLYTALKKNHYLTSSSRPIKYQMIYTLSLPPDSMKFGFSIPDVADSVYLLERSKNNDTLKVWLKDSTLYSMPLITSVINYPMTDTTGVEVNKVDTIKMRFVAPRPSRRSIIRKTSFTIGTNISAGQLKPGQKIVLTSQTPLKMVDTSRIRLYELKDNVRRKIEYKLLMDSSNFCRYLITADLPPGKNYLYIADTASYENIFNEYTDSTGIKFTFKDPASYMNLTLNLHDSNTTLNSSGYRSDRIIQLLNGSERLISEERVNNNKIIFPLLESGIYRLRVIYDLNGDGKWTTGDFAGGRQPEAVSYFPTEIEIKPGWDVIEDWNIGVINVKDYKLRKKIAAKK